MIRTFYDILRQGTTLVHQSRVRETEVFIDDNFRNLELINGYHKKLILYSDFIEPALEEHFDGEEIKPDLPEHEAFTGERYPWKIVGHVPRTPRIVDFYKDHPDWALINWYEADNSVAEECFDVLEQIIRRTSKRQSLLCIDGPLEGDLVNMYDGEWRVEVNVWDDGPYIYERTENNLLRYIRASK